MPANGSLERISHRRTLHSRNSQFINLIGQCIAIEFAGPPTAKGRRVLCLGNEYTFPFFSSGFTRARGHFRLIVFQREKAENERVKMMTVRQKGRRKKFVGRRDRAELFRPAILAVLTFFQKRDAPPRAILEVETLVAKDPRRKHDSQLMISPLDKDMETLPRQDASTPVLRQIN